MSVVRLLPGCGGFVSVSSTGAARPLPGGGFVAESGTVDLSQKALSGAAIAEATAIGGLKEFVDLSGNAAANASAAAALLLNGIFAEDGFAYADNINLAAANSAMWAKTAWMGTKSIGVQGQKLYGSELGANAIYAHSTTPPSPDYSVSLDITAGVANLGSSHVAVVGRETEDFYGVEYVSGGFELFKYRYFYGKTLYGSYAFPLAVGASVNVRLEMIGGDIAVYLDNSPTPVLTYTDATPLTTVGKAGVYAYTTASADWTADNFKAQIATTGAGNVDLSGTATATPVVAAAISIDVPLAGVGLAVATADGALSITVPPVELLGAATVTASTQGGLSLSIPLAGASIAQALAQAGIVVSKPLSGTVVAEALTSANLSGGVSLSGAGASEALASATISLAKAMTGGASGASTASAEVSLNVSLSGAAISGAVLSGAMDTAGQISLSGVASAQPSIVGGITHGIPLHGAALSVATVTGEFLPGLALTGGALSSADTSGTLSQAIPLSGSAASASMITGGLDVTVQLSAQALVEALVQGALSRDLNLAGVSLADASAYSTITLMVNLDGSAVAGAVSSLALVADGTLVPMAGWSVALAGGVPRDWSAISNVRDWRVDIAPRVWAA